MNRYMYDSEVVKYMISTINKLYPSCGGFLNGREGIIVNLDITPVRYDLVIYKANGVSIYDSEQSFVERKVINNKLSYQIIDGIMAYFKEMYDMEYFEMQDFSIIMGFRNKIKGLANCSFVGFKISVSPDKKLAGQTIKEYKKYIWNKYLEDIKNTYGYQIRLRNQAYYIRNVASYYMSKENILDMLKDTHIETLRSLLAYIPQAELLDAYDKIEGEIVSDDMPRMRKKKE